MDAINDPTTDLVVAGVIFLGIVFVALPTVIFIIWFVKEFIKFWIDEHFNKEEDDV